MSILPSDSAAPRAERVRVTRNSLVVDLVDGRTIIAPLSWYPRLHQGSPAEQMNWRLIARGEGIRWPDLDEDISVEGLLAGTPSGESQESLKAWLEKRRPRRSGKRPQKSATGSGAVPRRKRRSGPNA